MQKTYKTYGMEQYADQIVQMYKRKTGCSYTINNNFTKEIVARHIDGTNKRFRGRTWNAVAFEISKLMNTNKFRLHVEFLKGEKK